MPENMQLRDFTYRNAYISFEHETLLLDKLGIYLVTGENGSGKSTLVESIVFGNEEISFASQSQEQAYWGSRGSLFAYVPQRISAPHIRAVEWLCRGNGRIPEKRVRALLDSLNAAGVDLQAYVNELSGGERTKLAVASALLKDCPYVFLDEPSNNLDDESVEALCKAIQSYASGRTVILLTHDERIVLEKAYPVRIEGGRITQGPEDAPCSNTRVPSALISPPRFSTTFKIQRNLLGVLARCAVFVILAAIAFMDVSAIAPDYAINQEKKPDTICIYDYGAINEGPFGEFNEAYFKAAHLDESSPKIGNTFYLQDVPELARQQGVRDIYALDIDISQRVAAYTSHSANGKIKRFDPRKIQFAAIPEMVLENYGDNTGDTFLYVLNQGRGPADGKREVALSKRMIRRLYGYKDAAQLLGENVTLPGGSYRLVGINRYDFAWVSYSEDEDNGWYHYTEDSFPAFLAKEKQDSLTVGWRDSASPLFDTIVLTTEKGCEREVLDYLMQSYSKTYYYSPVFDELVVAQTNDDLAMGLAPVNAGASALLAVVLAIVMGTVSREDFRRLRDLASYYLCPRKLKRQYLLGSLLLSLMTVALAILIEFAFSVSSYPELLPLMVLDAALALLGLIIAPICTSVRRREWWL